MIYHCLHESQRMIDRARLDASLGEEQPLPQERIDELARAFRRQYRTMRLEASCRLVDASIETGQHDQIAFFIGVLEQFKKKFDDSIPQRAAEWKAQLDGSPLTQLVDERLG